MKKLILVHDEDVDLISHFVSKFVHHILCPELKLIAVQQTDEVGDPDQLIEALGHVFDQIAQQTEHESIFICNSPLVTELVDSLSGLYNIYNIRRAAVGASHMHTVVVHDPDDLTAAFNQIIPWVFDNAVN